MLFKEVLERTSKTDLKLHKGFKLCDNFGYFIPILIFLTRAHNEW